MTKNLKVGLLLFGQPRHITKTKVHEQYHREIIDRYDTDVFAHAWSFSDSFDVPSWSRDKGTTLGDPFDSHIDYEEAILERYPTIKRIWVEPQKVFNFPSDMIRFLDKKWNGNEFYSHQNLHNIASQLYSISAVASLAAGYETEEHNVYDYDYWILARYDTELVGFPDLAETYEEYNHFTDSVNVLSKIPSYGAVSMPEGGHWNDLIQIYGMKSHYESNWPPSYLKNLYFDMTTPEVYENLILPIPEFFKMGAYNLYGSSNDAEKIPGMYANVIRNTY